MCRRLVIAVLLPLAGPGCAESEEADQETPLPADAAPL